MGNVFLELKNIKKVFGGVQALKGVDLSVSTGEIHCLAGENGCGKSTLIKVISGVHDATEGEIYIEGKKFEKLAPIESIHMGIQVIYQDFAVFPNLTVAENISMNKNLMQEAKTVNWKKAEEIAMNAMEKIGAHIDPRVKVERLSVANKQMVAICRAIINDARLLILDEPTTALTSKEVAMLYGILRNLKEKNMAIMIVNHKLNEIFEIADHLTILRNGENVATGPIGEFDESRFTMCMTGRTISDKSYRPDQTDEKILSVRNITKHGYFNNVSFEINKGDVLGITGLLGSGRSEIGDALFGVIKADTGEIELNGKKIVINTIQDAIANKIAYVPEDRLTQGLFLEKSVQDNNVAASIKKYLVKGRLKYKSMYAETADWIKKIGCVAQSPNAKIRTLSGGNAQKIVIAKWLNTAPALLILNGPTVGVDIGAKADIHKILHELAAQGIGIIIISDDLPEIIKNCNKVIVMKNGHMTGPMETQGLEETALSDMMSMGEDIAL